MFRLGFGFGFIRRLSLQDNCHLNADSLLLGVSPFLETKQAYLIYIAWILFVFRLNEAIDFISLARAIHVAMVVIDRFTLAFGHSSFERFLCLM